MKLNDSYIKALKPLKTTKRYPDGDGLFIEVTHQGAKRWRFRYFYQGKEKCISLGIYPVKTLKEAREARYQARRLLDQGIDPSEHRKQTKKIELVDDSFESIAREWLVKMAHTWTSSNHKKVTQRLERNVFPYIGKEDIKELKASMLLDVARQVEARGAIDTAHRVIQTTGQIFRYAIASGKAEIDPTPALKGALTRIKKQHLPALTEPKQLAGLLRAIDSYSGSELTKYALQLAPLVFVRPLELRSARWSDIDFANKEWRYLVTKTQTEHIVPLATQAIAILKKIQRLTGNSTYLFPSVRTEDRPMSDNTLTAALRRMGFAKEEMTAHGFRAIARTLLDEVLEFRPDIIEHQLAHTVKDPNGRAYNRTKHLDKRKQMMQVWADYLDDLKKS